MSVITFNLYSNFVSKYMNSSCMDEEPEVYKKLHNLPKMT